MILVPGEDSSTGNVTGGLRLARYVLGGQAAFNSICSISVASSASAFELLTRLYKGCASRHCVLPSIRYQ